MNEELHPFIKFVAGVMTFAAIVLSSWYTVIAFAGGTLPILGIELDGGIGYGLFWLIIVDPIVITVTYWLTLIVLVPLSLLFRPRSHQ